MAIFLVQEVKVDFSVKQCRVCVPKIGSASNKNTCQLFQWWIPAESILGLTQGHFNDASCKALALDSSNYHWNVSVEDGDAKKNEGPMKVKIISDYSVGWCYMSSQDHAKFCLKKQGHGGITAIEEVEMVLQVIKWVGNTYLPLGQTMTNTKNNLGF